MEEQITKYIDKQISQLLNGKCNHRVCYAYVEGYLDCLVEQNNITNEQRKEYLEVTFQRLLHNRR